jgi:hypothetical protein
MNQKNIKLEVSLNSYHKEHMSLLEKINGLMK